MSSELAEVEKYTRSSRFFLLVILILVFAMAARTPLDSDMWWHLRAGEETWQTRQPVTVDTFSYTRYGERWVNHSWLSQVGMYVLFQTGGYLALGAMMAALATLSMALVYGQMAGHPLLRAFALVLATAVAAKVWSPRPQLVSLVMFGLVGYILYLYKWKKQDYLWWLPVIFILWSNLHGGYVLGLLLMGATIAGEALNHALGFDGPEVIPWQGVRKLAVVGLIAGLVVVVNPNGLAMWAIPFQTVNVRVLQDFISEWASPDFHDLSQQPFLWLLLGVLGAVGLSRRRLDGTDLIAVAGFAYLALAARRNFGPFAMVAAPVLTRHLQVVAADWVEVVRPRWVRVKDRWGLAGWRRERRRLSPRMTNALNALILGSLALVAGIKLYAVTNAEFVAQVERRTYPKEAVAWIEANKPPGNVFNAYKWGGYLLWKLPEYPVFVDGRTDLYDDDLLADYLAIMSGGEGWQARLNQYEAGFLLVERDAGLIHPVRMSPEWEKRFEDDLAAVYVWKPPAKSEAGK